MRISRAAREEFCLATAESFTERRDFGPTFDIVPKVLGFPLALAKILIHGYLVLEIKSDGAINCMKRDRGKAVLNLFRRGPLVELVNDGVKRNTRAREANSAIAIFKQWIARCEHDTHGLNISDMLPIFERSAASLRTICAISRPTHVR